MSTFSFKFSKLNKSKYCVCTTAADVAEKIVSITDSIFALNAGVIVNVLFQNANTADSPTLNVNSTGAKNIFHRGYQITSGTNKNELKDVVQFIYDGTNWRIIGNLVNTSNTTGASATSGTKMYPVAAFGQYGAAQTFTNSNVYIGADNELYSNNKKVATQTDITALNSKLLTQEQVSCAVPTGCSLIENHIYKLGKLCVGSLAIYIADVFSESYIATIAKKPVATAPVLIYQNSTYKNGVIDNATGRIIGSELTNGYLCQMSFAYITND